MKKLFLMMFALLGTALSVCAGDRVTSLSQLSNDKVYVLKSRRAFLLYSEKFPGRLCANTGTEVGSVTASLSDINQQFRIEKNGDNYYLFCEGAGKYVKSGGVYERTPSTPLRMEWQGATDYPWKLIIGDHAMNTQNSAHGSPIGIVVNGWTFTDEGNCYYIEEAIPMPKTYTVVVAGTDDAGAGITYGGHHYKNGATFETSVDIETTEVNAMAIDGTSSTVYVDGRTIYVVYLTPRTKYYTIQCNDGYDAVLDGYLSMNDEYCRDGNFLLANSNPPRDTKGLWAFVPFADNKYWIFNYSTGISKVLGITGDWTDARATMVNIDDAVYATTFSSKTEQINQGGVLRIGIYDVSELEPIYGVSGDRWWCKFGDFLTLRWDGCAYHNYGCFFYITEVDPADYSGEVGISSVAGSGQQNVEPLIYDLSGRRLGKAPAKQVYIQNGTKKVKK